MIAIFRHNKREDEEAFDELFRSSYASLYRRAFALLNDEEESRDVVSEVFAYLLERQTDANRMNVAYLMTMVHSRALDVLRRRRVEDEARRRMMQDGEMLCPTDETSEERLRELLRFIDTELTEQTRRILRMCYDERLTYREVAERLGISTQAVNKHISQALSKLRERFR